MTDITIWHNPRCYKSRATLHLLQENGIAPAQRKYLEEPPLCGRNQTCFVGSGDDCERARSTRRGCLQKAQFVDCFIRRRLDHGNDRQSDSHREARSHRGQQSGPWETAGECAYLITLSITLTRVNHYGVSATNSSSECMALLKSPRSPCRRHLLRKTIMLLSRHM